MDFTRPKHARHSDPDLDCLAAAEHELSSKINAFEQFINEAPRQALQQQEERRTVMPPPDDLADRRREKVFYESYTRREIRNVQRSQTRNLLLLPLLLAATVSIALWVYSVLQAA
jgi:hypothetical protein